MTMTTQQTPPATTLPVSPLQQWLSTELTKVYIQFKDTGIYTNQAEFASLWQQEDYGNRPGLSAEEYRLATSLQALRQQFTTFLAQVAPPTQPSSGPSQRNIMPFPPAEEEVPSSPPQLEATKQSDVTAGGVIPLPVPTNTKSDLQGAQPEEDIQLMFLRQMLQSVLLNAPADLGIMPALDEKIYAAQVAFDMGSEERQEFMDVVMRRLIIPIMRVFGVTAVHWGPVIPQIDSKGNTVPTNVPDSQEALEHWWKQMSYMQNFIPGDLRSSRGGQS